MRKKNNFSLLKSITDNTTQMFQIQTLTGKDIIFIHSGEAVREEKGYVLLAVSFTVFSFLIMLRTGEKNLQGFKLQASETIYNHLESRP